MQIAIAVVVVQVHVGEAVAASGDDARKLLNLVEALEDHDDVQKVYANFDIAEKIMEKVG